MSVVLEDADVAEAVRGMLAFDRRHGGLLQAARPNLSVRRIPASGVLMMRVYEGHRHETLSDLIVAARLDGLPVDLDWDGGGLWVDVRFGAVTLRALDYHTTCEATGALERLRSYPLEALPVGGRTLGDVVALFWAAHEAYVEAEGVSADEVERLFGEASRWWEAVCAWPEDVVSEVVREAGVEYTRPKYEFAPVVESGPTDWSRGRGAA